MDIITAAEATKANLSVSSYNITNIANSIVYGKCLVGTAKIKNNKNVTFDGKIKLMIWNQPNGSGSAYGGSSKTYELVIPGGKTVTIDFNFDGLSENNKYYLSASYVNQDGSLGNGGVWDLDGWMMRAGVATWKTDGTIVGKAHKTSLSTSSTACGLLADCSKTINRILPNSNPNTIYVISDNMEIPDSLERSNVVHGKHANRINLVNDNPYYLPATFKADTTSFTYTFAETEDGTKWHAFTMPFRADSIFLDDQLVSLEDTLNHFWIYELAAENLNGKLFFKQATSLRGGTPYIIAADKTMAGRSLVFRSNDVTFYKTGTDQMVVSSKSYKFHGNTYAPKLKNIYLLNEEGTAFEYTTTAKTLGAMAPYFTTELPDSLRPESIVLPEIPVKPNEITLDEMAANVIEAGTYDKLILNRTFEVGFNTICLPFQVDDITSVFGYGVQAYEFYGLRETEVNFVKTDTLAAGQPYIIVFPDNAAADIPSTYVLENITINEESIEAGFVEHSETILHGTYCPVLAVEQHMEIFGLAVDGTLESQDQINGFRAYFTLPDNARDMVILLWDDATGISKIGQQTTQHVIYNLSGQRLDRMQKGINIINGKKVLK